MYLLLYLFLEIRNTIYPFLLVYQKLKYNKNRKMSRRRQQQQYEEMSLVSKHSQLKKAYKQIHSQLPIGSVIDNSQDFQIKQNFSELSMNSNIIGNDRNSKKSGSDLSDKKSGNNSNQNKISKISISRSNIESLAYKVDVMEKQNLQIEHQYKCKIIKLKEQLLLKQKGTLQLTKQLNNLQKQHTNQIDEIKSIAIFLKTQQQQKKKIRSSEKGQKIVRKTDFKSNSPETFYPNHKLVTENQKVNNFDMRKKVNLSPKAIHNFNLRKSQEGRLPNNAIGKLSPRANDNNPVNSLRNSDMSPLASPNNYSNPVASPKRKTINLVSNSPRSKKLNLSPRAALRVSTSTKQIANINSNKRIQFPSEKNLGLREKAVLFK